MESGSGVIVLSWQCLPAPGVPSMAVLPLGDAAVLAEVWDSLASLGGAAEPGLPLQQQSFRPNCTALMTLLSLVPVSFSGPWGEAWDCPCTAIARRG